MRFCGDLRGDVSALPPQKFQVAFYTYLCYIMTLRSSFLQELFKGEFFNYRGYLMNFLKRFFKLQENNTTVKREVYSGTVTFLAVSYILAVNPAILGSTGMDRGGVFFVTAIAAAFIADMSLYPFWGFKLDASFLIYIDSPSNAFASVSTGYIITRLLMTVALLATLFAVLHRATTKELHPYGSRVATLVMLIFFGGLMMNGTLVRQSGKQF